MYRRDGSGAKINGALLKFRALLWFLGSCSFSVLTIHRCYLQERLEDRYGSRILRF